MKKQPQTSLHYLAIDQGGHSSRAIIFDSEGQALLHAKQGISVQRPRPGWVEQDAEALADSVSIVVAKVLAQAAETGLEIQAAGLATQRSSIVCWDKQSGQPLSPMISWQDRRTHASLASISNEQREAVHRLTGLFVTAHYGASKLHWCLEHLPAVKKAADESRLCQGPLASFLISRLTEERHNLVDPANASRTLLWGLASMDWEPELLHLFSVDREPLPRCVPTLHEYGTIVSGDYRIPLRIVTGDQPSALLAHGLPDTHTAYINMGTGAFVQRATGNTIRDSQNLLTGMVMSTESRTVYDLECTVNGAGSALTRVEEQLGVDSCEAETNLAKWLAHTSNPPLFLNGVSGIGSPWWVPDFESRFVYGDRSEPVNAGTNNSAIKSNGSGAEKIVAVAESILFLLQVNLDELQNCSGPLRQIVLTGGLAVNDELCQRLANLSQLSISRPKDCEATARGLVFHLAGFPGHWPNTGEGSRFEPQTDAPLMKRYIKWHEQMLVALDHHKQTESTAGNVQGTQTSTGPVYVAHRGDSVRFPENTASSIKAALQCGARYVEFDVQFTRDLHPVVIHDTDLQRITGKPGNILDLTLEEISHYRACMPDTFGRRFQDEPVASLQTISTLLQDWMEVTIFVELKRASIRAFGVSVLLQQLQAVLQPLQDQNTQQLVLISFDAEAVAQARQYGFQRTGWVFDEWNETALATAKSLQPDFLFTDMDCIPEHVASQWALQPSTSWRWVLYETHDLKTAKEWYDRGVTLIETDDISTMSGALASQGGELS